MKKTIYSAILILIAGIFQSYAMEIQNVDIHGFVSRGFLRSDSNNYVADTEDGTFQFSETGIHFSSDVIDNLHIGIQFIALDLGNVGNNEVKLDWAVADYNWRTWLGVRTGRMKIPLGLYNETRDLDMLRTCILLPAGVYSEMFRETLQSMDGVGLYGTLVSSVLGELSYQIQAGIQTMSTDGGIAKMMDDFVPFEIDDIKLKESYIGKLAWQTPLRGFQVACSMLRSPQFELISRQVSSIPIVFKFKGIDVFYGSAEYTIGDLLLATECNTTEVFAEFSPRNSVDMFGYYFMASYRFTGWLEIGTYYSVSYVNKDDKHGVRYSSLNPWPNAAQLPEEYRQQPEFMAWNKDFTLSLRFDLNESWLIKIESHFINGAYGAPLAENLPDPNNPEDSVEKDWWLTAVKITYSF